jgi:hypothetical protein
VHGGWWVVCLLSVWKKEKKKNLREEITKPLTPQLQHQLDGSGRKRFLINNEALGNLAKA